MRDALSYLDQVKVQFTDHPDVYNRFLDIMKDVRMQKFFLTQFKSQAIDTPGVIERVSTLFRGQPSLIQGFNTFLPPGYRIECSVDKNEGNFITVTTPSGTTTQTLGGVGMAGAMSRVKPEMASGVAGPPPIHDAPPRPPMTGPYAPPPPDFAERAPGRPPMRPASPPGPMGMPLPPMGAPPPPAGPYGSAPPMGYESMGRAPEPAPRQPVEFNHAINYVNKIKQRFSGDPDTYKQFLEILQTYQKEQRPIHEVYAQVTVLFDHAKDLLDEFKQFLPDTGGAPGSGGLFGMLGHVTNGIGPGEAAATGGMPPYEAMPRGAGPLARKKRVADEVPPVPEPMPVSKPPARKRSRKSDGPMPAPYLPIPAPPPGEVMGDGMYPPPYDMPPDGYMGPVYGVQPYPPPHVIGGGVVQMPHMASVDEVAFFDRVKKHMDDRATYLDFLKLLNLYTQDVIDMRTLVDRAALFLGGQPELFAAFKSLVGYDMGKHGWLENEDPVLENVPALERERIDLNTQKVCGTSYRKLPECEVNLSCSGRDPLCWEVLNDSWVSHPTWASEGESFNPHKKNVYEDALYRSEEERHEYDYHIEANLRTIALLEPIAARIAMMDAEERAAFRLKPGLGGQSKSIYQRIIKKVYGRDHGLEVIAALHDNPSVAVPVVLARLKQKDEEWKRAQREWNKVWREVDARNFYKALDHQGVNFKSADKKTITSKAFVQEIETLRAAQQQRRLATDPSLPRIAPRFQLEYAFEDADVFADVLRFALHFIDRNTSTFSQQDRGRITSVFRALLPRLFGVSPDVFTALARRRDEDDEDASPPEEDAEPSAAPNEAPVTWHVNVTGPAATATRASPPHVRVDLFGNTTLYVFLRLLQLVYVRLLGLKQAAATMAARTNDTWTKVNPLAGELGLMDTANGPAGLVSAIAAELPDARPSPSGSELPSTDQAVMRLHPRQYYAVLLELVTRLFDGDLEQSAYEEAVRFMFTQQGYTVFTLDKVIQALVKAALQIATDAKCQELVGNYEKTLTDLAAAPDAPDAVQVYKRMIAARMDAEHILGRDEALFRIEVMPLYGDRATSQALLPSSLRIQLLSHDDLTLEDPRDEEQRWLQYLASYCLWAPTEGLPAETTAPLLKRNLPTSPENEPDPDGTRYVVRNGLDIRVCMRTYRLFFVQSTEDTFARLRPSASLDRNVPARNTAARHRKWTAWVDARLEVMKEAEASEAKPEDGEAQAEASEAKRGDGEAQAEASEARRGDGEAQAEASEAKHEPPQATPDAPQDDAPAGEAPRGAPEPLQIPTAPIESAAPPAAPGPPPPGPPPPPPPSIARHQ